MKDRDRGSITVETGRKLAIFLAVVSVLGAGLPLMVVHLGGPDVSPVGTAAAEPPSGSCSTPSEFKLGPIVCHEDTVDVSGQETAPLGVEWNDDGSKMYVVGVGGIVYEYEVSDAFEVSTASFARSFDASAQETAMQAIEWNDDGSKMYLVGSDNDNVYEYSLSKPYNVSSASHTRTFDVSSFDGIPSGIAWNTDGTKMFITGFSGDTVDSFDLSEAYNISTASSNQTLSVSSGPEAIEWSDDGGKMFILYSGPDNVREYNVTAAYDLSTATAKRGIQLTDIDNDAAGMDMKDDGSKLYLSGQQKDNVYQFGLSVANRLSRFERDLDVSTEVPSPEGMAWNDDGTKLYAVSSTQDNVTQFSVSDAYNVSSATSEKVLNVSAQAAFPEAIEWNGDGTKLYILDSTNDEIYEYELTSGYDIGTANFKRSLDISSQDTNAKGLAWNSDGTKLFVADNAGDNVTEWAVSEAYNVSTATFSTHLDVSDADTGPHGIFWNTDGTKLFLAGDLDEKVYEYVLSTAYDISTATLERNVSVVFEDSSVEGVSFNSDGSSMYVVGNENDKIYEYDLTLSTSSSSGNTVSGTVVNQHGDTVPNATVEIWQIKDDQLSEDAGETTSEAATELVKNVTRAVPRDRFDQDLDPIRSSDLTSAKHVMVHDESAYIENSRSVVGDRKVVTVGSSDLTRPLIELESGQTYAFSIWDRTREPTLEDGIDDAITPGVTTTGTIVIRAIGPGNSTVKTLEVETTDQVKTGWPVTVKTHEYARIRLPVGYYEAVPKSGGEPIVLRVGQPEKIPRHFNKDLKDVDGNAAEIAKTIQSEVDAGTFKRVTVETNETGYFSHDVPSGYSTVAITAFDGQGLTDGITDPTIADLRTQVVQQDYNGSIYLSSSPKIVEPPKSGIVITVVEIERPTFSDLQAYLDLMSWLDELLNDEAFARLSTLWTDPVKDVSDEELRERAEELDDLIQQNDELSDELEETQEELERLREELETEEISREETKRLLANLTKVVQETQPEITVNVEEPELEVPEDDSEPTLLNLRLPIETRAGEDSSLTKEGVAVLVHFDNGTSTNMPERYWSIDNSIGSSQGTGSEIVIEDYPIASDVAVASIEVLVANSEGVGRTEVPVQNPAFEGTPPELASINVGSMRPGPDEKVSVTVTPTDSSTYQKVAGATVYDPNGSTISSTLSGSKVTFTTNGAGSHLIQLQISDGSRNYTESIRIKAGDESLQYPASVRVHNGILGRTLIASDGVESAELETSRGGSSAQITAKVDDSDVPNEIHVHAKEITGLQQDVTVSVVSSSDEARISRDVLLKLHLSKLSEDAIVRIDGEPVTTDGNQFGKVSDEGDSTLITAVARGGSAKVSINNNPSLLDRILFTVEVEVGQRLPDVPGLTIWPPAGGGLGVGVA